MNFLLVLFIFEELSSLDYAEEKLSFCIVITVDVKASKYFWHLYFLYLENGFSRGDAFLFLEQVHSKFNKKFGTRKSMICFNSRLFLTPREIA